LGNKVRPTNVIERAFELACNSTTIEEVRSALKREGYSSVDAHLAGPTIKADLKKRFAADAANDLSSNGRFPPIPAIGCASTIDPLRRLAATGTPEK
jgi:hypothetical protein